MGVLYLSFFDIIYGNVVILDRFVLLPVRVNYG